MPAPPIRYDAAALDLSPRVFHTTTVAASPTGGRSRHRVADDHGRHRAVKAVYLFGQASWTVGTNGVTACYSRSVRRRTRDTRRHDGRAYRRGDEPAVGFVHRHRHEPDAARSGVRPRADGRVRVGGIDGRVRPPRGARGLVAVIYTSERANLLRFARENYDGREPQAIARVLRTVPLDSPGFDRALLDAARRSRK
jgi:hypothetical protein